MKCAECGRETDTLRSAIKDGQFLSERCDRCLNSFGGYSDYARKYERDNQRRKFSKDILQKWDGDKLDKNYVDAYPEQFDEKTRRDYGINRKQF